MLREEKLHFRKLLNAISSEYINWTSSLFPLLATVYLVLRVLVKPSTIFYSSTDFVFIAHHYHFISSLHTPLITFLSSPKTQSRLICKRASYIIPADLIRIRKEVVWNIGSGKLKVTRMEVNCSITTRWYWLGTNSADSQTQGQLGSVVPN